MRRGRQRARARVGCFLTQSLRKHPPIPDVSCTPPCHETQGKGGVMDVEQSRASRVSRRDFLQLGAAAGAAGAAWSGTLTPAAAQEREGARASDNDRAPDDFNEATIAQLQAAMANGRVSSVELTRFYLARIGAIDENGPRLNSVLELNPDALALADHADALRRRKTVLGPLHGIPILLKDNIDTGDRMQTTAGSFALAGRPALRDSTVAAKL